jgi:very-short-patch-repair endonuclease
VSRIDPVLGFRLPPAPDADELTHLLHLQSGVVSRRQALRCLSEKALRHRLSTERWQVAHRGIYLAHSGPITRQQRRWIAALAAGGGRRGILAGLSALEMFGLRGHVDRAFHILVAVGRRDRDPPPGVVIHRIRDLHPADLNRVGGPPSTMPARSVVDAAQWAETDDRARTIVAAAFQQRLVTGVEMTAALDRLARVRRRALIAVTAADAQLGSHSVSEVDFLRLCRRGRLPMPSRQVVRTDARGGRRYLDALFEQWQLQVEIDGGQHLEVRHWWADMQRQNDLWVAGLRVLRFPAWVIRSHPEDVLAQVRAALIAAGWHPPS